MNKKDFIALFISNLMIIILLIEHLCGLEFALEIMYAWTIIAMFVNIQVLRNYIFISVFVTDDHTK